MESAPRSLWIGGGGAPAGETEYSLFVGDLGPEVSDYPLLVRFSLTTGRVVWY
jgi:hypothetical protein